MVIARCGECSSLGPAWGSGLPEWVTGQRENVQLGSWEEKADRDKRRMIEEEITEKSCMHANNSAELVTKRIVSSMNGHLGPLLD